MARDIKILEGLASYLEEELKKELIGQQHTATKVLVNSVKVKVNENPIAVNIQGTAEDYGRYVNTGRKKGAKGVPISVLESWIRVKGFVLEASQTVTQLAYAIQTSIKAKGIPSKPYVNWSEGNTLKRTGWVDDVLKNSEDEIKRAVTLWAGRNINITLENLASKYGDKKVL